MKTLLLMLVALSSTQIFAVELPTLAEKLDALENGDIRCSFARRERGELFDYDVVYVTPSLGSGEGKLDINVVDWSRRSREVEMNYKDACTYNGYGEVKCKWPKEGKLSFNLMDMNTSVWENPLIRERLVGFAGYDFTIDFNSVFESDDLMTCTYYL